MSTATSANGFEHETVTVRPITFAEIEALAAPDAEPVEVFTLVQSLQHGRTLTPITLTPRTSTRHAVHHAHLPQDAVPHRALGATVPETAPNARNPWKADPNRTVGYEVKCDTVDLFGGQSGVSLFTTPEAEETAELVNGYREPAAARLRLQVADPHGTPVRLTPIYGAQVSTGFVLTGIDPEEARARTEAALRAEFGDAMRPNTKVQSRTVPDKKVNVFGAGPDKPLLAANVLSCEVSYVMGSNMVTVEEVDPASAPIMVGQGR